jgi:hypothetical protein
MVEQHFIEQIKLAKTAQQHALNTLNQLNTELATLKTQQQHWQQESERRTERQQAAFNLDSSLKCNSSHHAALRSFSAKNTAWGVW